MLLKRELYLGSNYVKLYFDLAEIHTLTYIKVYVNCSVNTNR